MPLTSAVAPAVPGCLTGGLVGHAPGPSPWPSHACGTQEGQEFGDIFLGSYRDMYCNLTLKVMHDVSSAGPATSSRWMMTASTWTACPPSWLGLTWRGPASSPGRSGRSPGSPPAGDMWHGRTTVLTSTRPTPAGMGMWAYGGGARPTPHGSCLDLTTSTRMPTSSMRRW